MVWTVYPMDPALARYEDHLLFVLFNENNKLDLLRNIFCKHTINYKSYILFILIKLGQVGTSRFLFNLLHAYNRYSKQ